MGSSQLVGLGGTRMGTGISFHLPHPAAAVAGWVGERACMQWADSDSRLVWLSSRAVYAGHGQQWSRWPVAVINRWRRRRGGSVVGRTEWTAPVSLDCVRVKHGRTRDASRTGRNCSKTAVLAVRGRVWKRQNCPTSE